MSRWRNSGRSGPSPPRSLPRRSVPARATSCRRQLPPRPVGPRPRVERREGAKRRAEVQAGFAPSPCAEQALSEAKLGPRPLERLLRAGVPSERLLKERLEGVVGGEHCSGARDRRNQGPASRAPLLALGTGQRPARARPVALVQQRFYEIQRAPARRGPSAWMLVADI